jgi:hypothetical protein
VAASILELISAILERIEAPTDVVTASILDLASAEIELATEANEAVTADKLELAKDTLELATEANEAVAAAILELISMVGVAAAIPELNSDLLSEAFTEIEDAAEAMLELASAEIELANEANEAVAKDILELILYILLLATKPTEETNA